jgi:hypothetical protein
MDQPFFEGYGIVIVRRGNGGDSNQSFLDDVVDNFVDVKDSGWSTLAELGSSWAGGGTVAASWGGVTPLNAARQWWQAYSAAVRIPGLIGFRSAQQLAFTAGVTWATNAVLLKGAYNAGVLAGSIFRTSANRLIRASCGP